MLLQLITLWRDYLVIKHFSKQVSGVIVFTFC